MFGLLAAFRAIQTNNQASSQFWSARSLKAVRKNNQASSHYGLLTAFGLSERAIRRAAKSINPLPLVFLFAKNNGEFCAGAFSRPPFAIFPPRNNKK